MKEFELGILVLLEHGAVVEYLHVHSVIVPVVLVSLDRILCEGLSLFRVCSA